MMKSVKNTFLMVAMAATMVVSFAAPAMAADDELRAIKPNDVSSGAQEEGPTAARDHGEGGASNDGGGSSPAAEESVKDRGIRQCDITPSECRNTADDEEEDSASHEPRVVCIKAPCPASSSDSSAEEDSATHESQAVCIKAPCPAGSRDSASGEEEDHLKDHGIRLCDITPPYCQDTGSDPKDPATHDDEAQPLKDPGIRQCDIMPIECPDTPDSAHKPFGPSDEEAGQTANSAPADVYGCPYGYDYLEEHDACFPPSESLDFFPVLSGEKPWPDGAGGYVVMPGHVAGDTLEVLGAGVQIGTDYLEDALLWYGEDGGPIGWGIQGLGYTVGFAGDLAGTIVSGAGEVVNGVSEAVGEVVDAVGDAAEDAWDEVSSWF